MDLNTSIHPSLLSYGRGTVAGAAFETDLAGVTHTEKSWNQVSCVVGWGSSNCSLETQHIYMRQKWAGSEFITHSWRKRQASCPIGGLWRAVPPGCNHPGGRSCGWHFLDTLSTSVRRPGEGLACPMSLKHWSPWRDIAQVYNKYSLRTSSAPYGLATLWSGCHDFPDSNLKLWPKWTLFCCRKSYS